MVIQNVPLSRLVENFEEYPQVLVNIRIEEKIDFNRFPEIIKTREEIKNRLGNRGRLNLRYSGTEPLARVMIEGTDKEQIQQYAQQMVDVISKHLGAR